MMRAGTLIILGGVKGRCQLCHFVYIRLCGHDTCCCFSPIISNGTCKVLMMKVGTLLISSRWVKGQDQLCHLMLKETPVGTIQTAVFVRLRLLASLRCKLLIKMRDPLLILRVKGQGQCKEYACETLSA